MSYMTIIGEIVSLKDNFIVMGIFETIYMVFLSTLFSYIIGIPCGILLVVTDKNGIKPMPFVNKLFGICINFLRSIPFVILLIMILPVTRAIIGTTIGPGAVIPPLVFGAAPYIARMVEASLKEVNLGVIEAAKSMGASTAQIIFKVYLPEAVPSLYVGAAISITTILGYSAMAGFTGGGGLGSIAINYGYYRHKYKVMIWAVLALIILVQLTQDFWMRLSRLSDKRIR